METLGVLQVVDDSNTTTPNNNSTAMPKKYCMLYGKPRADVISPQDLVQEIVEAQHQVQASRERCILLQQALHQSPCHPKHVLKDILRKYPQVANDFCYMAAFRNTHVDVSAVERERFKQECTIEKNQVGKDESSILDTTSRVVMEKETTETAATNVVVSTTPFTSKDDPCPQET